MEKNHLMASEMSLNMLMDVGRTQDVSIYDKLTLFEDTLFEGTF